MLLQQSVAEKIKSNATKKWLRSNYFVAGWFVTQESNHVVVAFGKVYIFKKFEEAHKLEVNAYKTLQHLMSAFATKLIQFYYIWSNLCNMENKENTTRDKRSEKNCNISHLLSQQITQFWYILNHLCNIK
jgi:hypothetical protein